MKHSKHDMIVKNYQETKSNHLEKLATKMLENDKKFRTLKSKKINTKFLNLF